MVGLEIMVCLVIDNSWFSSTCEHHSMIDTIVDDIRGQISIAFYALVILPATIAIFTPGAYATQEFRSHRMQQYDLQGTQQGSRAHGLNIEARSIHSKNVLRKCVVVKWKDLTQAGMTELTKRAVGGLVVLMPAGGFGEMGVEEREAFMELEASLLSDKWAFPVYFAEETPILLDTLQSLDRSASLQESASATDAFLGAIFGDANHLYSANPVTSKALPDFSMQNIYARMLSYDNSGNARTVVVVAHYDAFGASPTLSFGSDSNASGVAALMELARLFSKLYASAATRPRHNLLFLLSAGGKFNYQGTRNFLDEHSEQQDGILSATDFALCLEAIGSGDALHFHVSKPPKEGSHGDRLLKDLETVGAAMSRNVSLVHRKIVLGAPLLNWEHERFSLKRLPGYTLSHYESPDTNERRTILDNSDLTVNLSDLAANTAVIAESLARYLYGTSHLPVLPLMKDRLAVSQQHLEAWLRQLTEIPRSAQLFDQPEQRQLLQSMHAALEHWAHEVQTTSFLADKKDPEFVMYTGTLDTISVHRVKPAVFDLVLAMGIAAYLAVIYLLISNFFVVQDFIQVTVESMKNK